MATLTPNYSFSLPAVNSPTDEDLWGGLLNANWSSLDGLLKTAQDAAVPIGSGVDFWGDTVPPRWILSYGQAISRTTYSALFTEFGVKYGAGDGSTTFNMPDKRGRASIGRDNMGGTVAGRITNALSGIVGTVMGAFGGLQAVILAIANLPAHDHDFATTPNAGGDSGAERITRGNGGTGSKTTTQTGGGVAHQNVQPSIVCNYIIYAGV